jgi:hypothetical protein
MAVAVEFKNCAALDRFEAKELAIAETLLGSKQATVQVVGDKRVEMREIVCTKLVQELMLK